MAGILEWLERDWFLLLQSVGIIGGMIFTGLSLRQASQARRIGDMLTLTEQHRELWHQVHERAELHRIARREVDLVSTPISDLEEEFLNMVIVHYHTGWLLAREGALLPLEALKKDVRSFFSLPIPREVWRRTKRNRDGDFARFVETCLK